MKELIGDFEGWKVYMIVILICWALMSIACIIDLWSGINAARAIKEKIKSHKLRLTLNKIGDYWRFLLITLMFDALLFILSGSLPYTTIAATACILLIEGRSLVENSRKKKGNASKIVDIANEIVDCADDSKAKEIIKKIINIVDEKK